MKQKKPLQHWAWAGFTMLQDDLQHWFLAKRRKVEYRAQAIEIAKK